MYMNLWRQRVLYPFVFEQLDYSHVLRRLEKRLLDDLFSNLREFYLDKLEMKKHTQPPCTDKVLCVVTSVMYIIEVTMFCN